MPDQYISNPQQVDFRRDITYVRCADGELYSFDARTVSGDKLDFGLFIDIFESRQTDNDEIVRMN